MKLFQGIIIWLIEAISVSSCLVQNLRQWTPPEAGENALIAAEKEMKSSRGLSISAVWLLYQWALPTYRGDEELGASVPHCDTQGKDVIVIAVFEKKVHMQMDRKSTVLSAGFCLFCPKGRSPRDRSKCQTPADHLCIIQIIHDTFLHNGFFSLCVLKGKITALKQGINQVLSWTFQCQQYNFSKYG